MSFVRSISTHSPHTTHTQLSTASLYPTSNRDLLRHKSSSCRRALTSFLPWRCCRARWPHWLTLRVFVPRRSSSSRGGCYRSTAPRQVRMHIACFIGGLPSSWMPINLFDVRCIGKRMAACLSAILMTWGYRWYACRCMCWNISWVYRHILYYI